MPVHKTKSGCYQWGNKGAVYCGKGAKEKAARQGRAVKASEGKGKKKG